MSQQIMLCMVSTLWRPYSPSSPRTGLVLDVSLNVGFDPPQSLQRVGEAVAVLREHLISSTRLERRAVHVPSDGVPPPLNRFRRPEDFMPVKEAVALCTQRLDDSPCR